ncbi:MAG: MCE family protein [Candidatus Saganbacteria bacterium]|nr:MCE family protein [Candidatus Saganbacteria bacterium]
MAMSKTAKVGLLAIIALLALSVVIIWKTDIFMISKGYDLIGSFYDIEGLTIGSEVRYRGYTAGKVMKIDPGPQAIVLNAIIEKDVHFPSDSTLRISYDGIVGQKFLEIRPGSSEVAYQPPNVLYGKKTASIVDFVDLASQNLEETKEILANVLAMVGDPQLHQAITNTILTANRVALDIEALTQELRATNNGIQQIVADPEFQENVKQTMQETKETLEGASNFFKSVEQTQIRTSAGVEVGTRYNSVRGDIDILQGPKNYFRLGIGEGPNPDVSLLDVLFNSKINKDFGFRLGVINNHIGGGVALYSSKGAVVRGDIYDINNPRPNWPKVRLGYERQMVDYLDLTVGADDILNEGARNFSLGIRVKSPGDVIY